MERSEVGCGSGETFCDRKGPFVFLVVKKGNGKKRKKRTRWPKAHSALLTPYSA
jgi:hypothetical protein